MPKKNLWDRVKDDIKSFGLSCDDAHDKDDRTVKLISRGQAANPSVG